MLDRHRPDRNHRHRRRRLRLGAVAASAVLLASPVLTSCGFDYATSKVNTISAGVNDRSGQVYVLGAVVVAEQDDLGVFAATLVNNSTDEPAALVEVSGGERGGVSPVEEVGTVEIPQAFAVNMFQRGGIPVTGSFTAGDFVTVSLAFESGQTSTLLVPVYPPCDQYDPEELPGLELPSTPAEGDTSAPDEGPAAEEPASPESSPPEGSGGAGTEEGSVDDAEGAPDSGADREDQLEGGQQATLGPYECPTEGSYEDQQGEDEEE